LFFQVSFVSVEEGRVEDKEGRGAGSWEQARTLQHAQASTAAGLAVTYRRSSKGWCVDRMVLESARTERRMMKETASTIAGRI